jgi:hypothetical protein
MKVRLPAIILAMAFAAFATVGEAQLGAPPAPAEAAPPIPTTGPAYIKGKPVNNGFGLDGGEFAFVPAALEQQKKQFDAALAALQPQRPGVHDVYVLSVGAWGEHVFEHEAEQSGLILEKHYAADGRTLALSNNFANPANSQPGGLPGATPGNLFDAFNKIGTLMDKDEDLFVLFITSHGASGYGIMIHDRDRMDYVLSPKALRAALDRAGIKKRVLILAACFSGQFVPAFANDPDTIVLTAAAADRTSFGCQAENDWTFFGDAMFNQALRAGGGLVPAFQRAKKMITEWETKDGLVPSNPQIYVGVDAAKVLAAAEQGQPAFAAATSPAAPAPSSTPSATASAAPSAPKAR